MCSDNLPTVVKLLKFHRGIAHHLLIGAGERDRPPSEGKSQVWLNEFDLDTPGLDEPP
jgi:hypothetical protein